MSNPDAVMVEVQLLVNRLKNAVRYLDTSVAECMRLPEPEEAQVRADASDAVEQAATLLGSMVPSYDEAVGNDPVEL